MRTPIAVVRALGAVTAGSLAAVAVGMAGAHALPQRQPKADAPAPYCLVDREYAEHGFVTVAGPPDGWVTAGTRPAGQLTMVDGTETDVTADADPYGGILYNVRVKHAQQPVTVDGIVCETT